MAPEVSLPSYAELHALSNFSFLRGASHPAELVERAHDLGYAALALTDECSLAGVVRAHQAAKDRDLHLIVGAEFRIADGPKVVLLAPDRAAYGALADLITRARRRTVKGGYRIERADLEAGAGGCLALLIPDCPLSPALPRGGGRGTTNLPLPSRKGTTSKLPLPLRDKFAASEFGRPTGRPRRGEPQGSGEQPHGWGERRVGERGNTEADARWIAECFPARAWIAAELLRGGGDRERLEALRQVGRALDLPLLAAGDVHMHSRGRKPLHDLLTAVRLKTTVQDAGYALHPNAERHLRKREVLARLYPPELLAETLRIAERCTFSLDELRYEYPDEIVPPGETPASHLRALTEAGLRRRYPDGAPPKVRHQIEHELALIAELRYEPFFLTVHDIVRFARSRDILCQGRGSAANSAVCYALGITEVDPSRLDLLFERFVSKERHEPPDIDVDFEHERREEVIQYVYDKYGRDRAALAATVISYRPKSALRDVGKALGLDLAQVDAIAGNLQWWDGRDAWGERLHECGFDPDNPLIRRLLAMASELIGFPRHLSQHVGGFVIARGPLSQVVPIENAAMAGRTVIQWDKDDLDALGLLKVDCLALGMLTAIHRALDLVSAWHGAPMTMAEVPPEDPATYAMIQQADTVGVFQIESRAQMAMLPRLKPRNYYDLVIEIALIRPGPIQGDMVHPYLRRREGIEPVSYPSAEVRAVLARTLGVPLFQEQVIKLAMVAAGFSPGEADRLRRSMATWRKTVSPGAKRRASPEGASLMDETSNGGIENFERKLIEGMRSRGYAEDFARRIYQQILGFGEYGFPESHSASFALLAYVSAWLKRHEPAAFTAALLNSQPMGFYAPAQLVADARRHAVEVRPVEVRASDWDCTLEHARGRDPDWRRDTPSSFPRKREPSGGLFLLDSRLRGNDQAGGDATRSDLSTVLRGNDETGGNAARPDLLAALHGHDRDGIAAENRDRDRQPTVRLGLRMVKGLSRAGADRLVAARAQRPFADVEDLARRAQLDRRDLDALAAADALASLAGNRHQARWQTLGVEPPLPLLEDAPIPEATPLLRAPSEGEDIVGDYAQVGLTLRRHPLAVLRPRLRRLHLCTAEELTRLPHGAAVRTGGLVITRQRPGTATGVVFVTLEDETGQINVIVWGRLVERFRRALLGARLLAVTGEVQREGEVIHVIAHTLRDHSALLGALPVASHDFH